MKTKKVIPATLEEAREMGQIRLHFWNQECIDIVQGILDAEREVDVMGKVDNFAIDIRSLSERAAETRLMSAIAKIAVALGASVKNYMSGTP